MDMMTLFFYFILIFREEERETLICYSAYELVDSVF